MNVYEIEGYWIAANNADEALEEYLDETCYPDNIFIGELKEDETEVITIKIRRLGQKELNSKSVLCCEYGGCEFCKDGYDDCIYVSYQDLINIRDRFPCVIAREI